MNKDRKEKKNVPNLRFPEFQGEWEIYKISDFLEFFTTNSLSWDQLEYGNENIYNLHYGLIHNGAPALINIENYKLPTIRQEHVPRAYTVCQNGDIAFADASEDTNDVAKVVEFMDCGGKDIVCGLHTIHGRDKLNITIKGFKGYAFSSVPFHHQMRKLAQGTKVYSVSQKNFSECFIGIPSKEEQTKIAHLLKLIDERISTQNKIIEKYESLIKGIADLLLFSKDHALQRTNLGSLCCIKKGEQINASELLNIGVYYVMNGGIAPSGYYSEYNSEADTISISEGGNSCGYVQYNTSKFWSGGHCYTLNEISKQVSNKYLYFYLKSREKDIMALRVGSGLPNIQKRDLERIEIQYPYYEKQREITRTLTILSNKIEAEHSLLSAFLKHKNYLLRNLFI